jgi:uncharacterized damage-inducible protein DinB
VLLARAGADAARGGAVAILNAMLLRRLTLGTCVITALATNAAAQTVQTVPSSLPVVPPTLRAGLLARFDESSAKVLQLAEAIPETKYAWRPAPGVRSISETLVHIALGNYYTGSDAGVKAPADILGDQHERTITNKQDVVAFVRRANTHLREALERLTDEDLQRPTIMFSQSTTYQNVYLFGIAHVHEHLGQLIAYARMNGVAPPWSRPH